MTDNLRGAGEIMPANGSLEMTIQILDSLGTEGLVVTPSEPNEIMVNAGASVGGVSPDVARRVYQVMLQAQD